MVCMGNLSNSWYANFSNPPTKVPYEKGFSDILRRELQKEGIHVIFSKGTTLEKKFANLHQRSQSRNQSTIFTGNTAPNVTTRVTYIGESGVTMKQRDTLQISDIKTGKSICALYTHIKDSKDHARN